MNLGFSRWFGKQTCRENRDVLYILAIFLKLFKKAQNSLSLAASFLLLCNILLTILLRISSDTGLMLQDSHVKELASMISAWYQENYSVESLKLLW